MKRLFFTTSLLVLFSFSLFAGVVDEDPNPATDSDVVDETDADEAPVTCTGISVGELEMAAQSAYRGNLTTNIGKDGDDIFQLEFYKSDGSPNTSLEVKSYDLGSATNLDYKTCNECARVLELVEGSVDKQYFQTEGTVTISEVKEGTAEAKGTISVKLAEAQIADDYSTTIVAGGDCLEIEALAFDTVCVPNCEGKVCGGDGCGGSCGDGCGDDKMCNEEGTECVGCTALSVDSIELGQKIENEGTIYGHSYNINFSNALGTDNGEDGANIQFYGDYNDLGNGTYDLAGTNYKDCNECVIAFEDSTDQGAARVYFQQSGTIKLESVETAGENKMGAKSKGKLENIILREASIAQDYTSTLNMNGACLKIESAAWDTTGGSGGTDEKPDESNPTDGDETDSDKTDSDKTEGDKTDSEETDDSDTPTDKKEPTPLSDKKSGSDGCSLLII